MAKPSCILVEDFRPSDSQFPSERARSHCRELERGNVLMFREPPFLLPAADREWLTAQRATESALHKNVSYRPGEDRLRGFADVANSATMHGIMRRYSAAVSDFICQFLSPYARRCSLDCASFRAVEEEGRVLSLHKRNDLLHVDAFPSRPTRGGRILRVFSNVHSTRPRVWIIGEPFAELAPRLAPDAGIHKYSHNGRWRRALVRLARALAFPVPDRSAYDRFMLHFHDFLKESHSFQQTADKVRLEFPPLATWLAFTDGCPHAVLSGQYALEQTFIVPVDALVLPEQAPIRVLERMAGTALA